MIHRLLQVLIAFIFLIAACTPAATAIPIATIPPTETPSPLPTYTAFPTETPSPSITPLPTIPTFTPTFDASTIVTVTPAAKAECPKEDPQMSFVSGTKVYDPGFSKEIKEFLNAGGSRRAVVTSYQRLHKWADNSVIQENDVTGDEIPELLFTEPGFLSAYTCNNGQYETVVLLGETYHFTQPIIVDIQDLNRNGLVEIIAMEGDARVSIVSIFEWDGSSFKNLIPDFNTMYGSSQVEALDANGDGVLELILKQGIPIWSEYYEGLPWRKENRTFGWDGQQFALQRIEFASPEYRFQAIQDADAAILQDDLDTALTLYQEAINNNQLHSFSSEIFWNLRANIEAQQGPNPAPSPTSVPSDNSEYPRLAAYAYYRIILLHIVQGKEQEADLAYQTLQQKFDNDPYGRPYSELATEFLHAYQSTHKMYDGCAATIQYAAKHPEILIPLGSDYHGWQSHTYVPADVCPFR